MFLAEEWNSTGELPTLNRELAKYFVECPKVGRVTCLVPAGQDIVAKDASDATMFGVHLVEAQHCLDPDASLSLSFPPDDLQKIDVVIGHGGRLGPQAQHIRNSRECRWVQFVHESHEELGMFQDLKERERKHKRETRLCEEADAVVAIGSKVATTYQAALRHQGKTVEEFTPGILEEFAKQAPSPTDMRRFGILVIGRGASEDSELKGHDLAAEAVGGMRREKYHLIFVGASEGKHEEIKDTFLKHGIKKNQLKVRSFPENRDELKKTFSEVDLCIMPSRTECFGLTALEAISAGVPILITKNSGLAIALEAVDYGSLCIVDSDDPSEWRKKIEDVLEKPRSQRLKEAAGIRDRYKDKYPWASQCATLVENICKIVH